MGIYIVIYRGGVLGGPPPYEGMGIGLYSEYIMYCTYVYIVYI